MAGKRPFIGSLGLLAMLEHENEVRQGWTARELAQATGMNVFNVLHHLERLRSYAQVKSEAELSEVRFRRKTDPVDRHDRRIQIRTLVWTISEKGSGRLKRKGGHPVCCPICPGPQKRK